jgi:hypothetical protein
MARLIYSAIASADGYVEDAAGSFDWPAPSEELMCFVNVWSGRSPPIYTGAGCTSLYGRRMYQTMLYWESADALPDQSPSPRPWNRRRAPGRGSSAILILTRSGG